MIKRNLTLTFPPKNAETDPPVDPNAAPGTKLAQIPQIQEWSQLWRLRPWVFHAPQARMALVNTNPELDNISLSRSLSLHKREE